MRCGDEHSVGVSTLDIEETEKGFAIPTMLPEENA